jgi:signal transduction histidine kinase
MRSAMIVPMRAHGRVLGAITFVTAGERARSYDEADLAMAQDLADRAALAIANAELYAASRRAVQVRDEFLSIASHELKTPLTALRLQAAQLERAFTECDPHKGVERAAKVSKTVQRLVHLVEELLDVSRISADQLRLDREQVDLTEIVRDVVARVHEQASRAGSEIHVSVPGPVVGTWDRFRIDLVIVNLLGNAIKYGEGKSIEVKIECTNDLAIVSVCDHGIGIAPDDQRRIFDRFERAVSSRSFGGFGLGLWIVRQVVEAHGGTIRVESALGRGATFRVELPRHPPAGG